MFREFIPNLNGDPIEVTTKPKELRPNNRDTCAEGSNQELWKIFNKLWTRAASGGPYIKEDWVRLEGLIMSHTR